MDQISGMVSSALGLASLPEPLESWVLDQIPIGIVLVNAELSVLSVNRLARELIEKGAGISVKDQRLTCFDVRSQQRLEQRIRAMQNSSDSTIALRVTRDTFHPDLQLRVATSEFIPEPANPAIRLYWIWIFDPATNRQIDPELIRELHGLTPTEGAVAAELFRNCSLDEVAVELGVTVNTVKTHLKHIFQKCEVSSQAELLQMLALGPR